LLYPPSLGAHPDQLKNLQKNLNTLNLNKMEGLKKNEIIKSNKQPREWIKKLKQIFLGRKNV
jgi:hypothetical protein